MYAILLGLYFAHRNGIMHRDLKPDKIMFEEENNFEKIKLRNFSTIYPLK